MPRLSFLFLSPYVVFLLFSFNPNISAAKVITVGPEGDFLFPSLAAKYANNGDVIQIDARGYYLNDVANWSQSDIKIIGINGRPHIRNNQLIKNGKAIWVIKGSNVTVENVEFSGAIVRDKNGAAIRHEGGNLSIISCNFHDNENGILSGVHREDVHILVDKSEFAFNGKNGRGRTHNIYIGAIGKFTFRNSFSHDAYIGHLIKSRARTNLILYNRLFEGKASYAIDLSNGGDSIVMGNVIYQDSSTDNSGLIGYGLEGLSKNGAHNLLVLHNSFLNSRKAGVFVRSKPQANIQIMNNIFSGNGDILHNGAKKKGIKYFIKKILGKNVDAYNVDVGEVLIENNLLGKNIFEVFTESRLQVRTKYQKNIIDKSIIMRDTYGNKLIPMFQIREKIVLPRKLLGSAHDLGAIEYQ